jgi:hypothetical protein
MCNGSTGQMKMTAGMDLGDNYSHLCLIDTESGVINVSPDYQAEVEVAIATDRQIDVLFTGFTVFAEPTADGVVISAKTNMQRLKEERTGGFGYRFVDPREILWGLLRASGMESEKIHIEGFEPGPLEVFEVATALDGVNVADTVVSLGQVRLLPHGPVATTDSTNTVRRRNRRLEGNRCGPGLAYDQNTR